MSLKLQTSQIKEKWKTNLYSFSVSTDYGQIQLSSSEVHLAEQRGSISFPLTANTGFFFNQLIINNFITLNGYTFLNC